MELNLVPLSVLTDEELLSRVYVDREQHSDVVIELVTRLEHALDELSRPVRSVDTLMKELNGSNT